MVRDATTSDFEAYEVHLGKLSSDEVAASATFNKKAAR